jgi:hypothetical protein
MQRDSFHLKLYDLLEASARFDLTAGGTVAKDHAGNTSRNSDLRVLPMRIHEASSKATSTHPSRIEKILASLRKSGPYLGLLSLPGGSVMVLLLWLYQQGGRK